MRMFSMLQSHSRHRLYREHKLVTAYLNDFTRLVGTTDFTDDAQVTVVIEALDGRIGLLTNHAKHEDDNIHVLLKVKGLQVYEDIEKDHRGHGVVFSRLTDMVETICTSANPEERVMMGHEFGLAWSHFEAQNLVHQYEEETVLMPALWEHCTDEELQAIDAKVYGTMSPDDMIGMVTALFPYMNADDHRFFLEDIERSTPSKFLPAFGGMAKAVNPSTNLRVLSEEELQKLMLHFGVRKEQLEQYNPVPQ
jgi:hypothetical protein